MDIAIVVATAAVDLALTLLFFWQADKLRTATSRSRLAYVPLTLIMISTVVFTWSYSGFAVSKVVPGNLIFFTVFVAVTLLRSLWPNRSKPGP